MLLPLLRALGWWPQSVQVQSELLPQLPHVGARQGFGEVGRVAREGRVRNATDLSAATARALLMGSANPSASPAHSCGPTFWFKEGG